MRAFAAGLALLFAAACGHGPSLVPAPPLAAPPEWAEAPVDMIALVRTRCFGGCPAYELTLSRGGPVQVRGDDARAARAVAQVPDSVLDALGRRALAGGFFALAARANPDREFCPVHATDHPTIRILIVQGNQHSEVTHYTGCFLSVSPRRQAPELAAVEELARAIDAAAGLGQGTN